MRPGPRPTCDCGDCPLCRRRESNREYMRAYGRAHRDEAAARGKAWYAKPENAARAKAQAAEHRRNTPLEKRRAQDKLYKALAKGVLVRPAACERCGRKVKPDAHHDDYSKPLEVRWLCRSCHGREHSPHD